MAWTCFHCGDVFTDEDAAREHFGPDPWDKVYCRIRPEELEEYRALEVQFGPRFGDSMDMLRFCVDLAQRSGCEVWLKGEKIPPRTAKSTSPGSE